MFKKIFLIIIALVVIVLAFVAGYCVAVKNFSQVQGSPISNLEKSPVVQNWMMTVYGNVTAISGNTLTLAFQEGILSVPIKESARIEFVTILEVSEGDGTLKTESETIQFSDIKIGDAASVFVEVKKNGELSGTNVSIMAPAPSAE